MAHTIIFRGGQPVASVEKSDPLHDEKVARAVNDAHAQNKGEGASAEITTADQDDEGKIAQAATAPTKKGK